MASDNEASCVSDPNFAVICSFLECFGKSCGIDYPDIAMLQEMVENAQEVPQQLIDLHVKLLRKTRKTVSAEKWERALVKFCHTYSNQDGWELERFGYKKARIAVKLRLLKVLLEAQFDMNQRFKNEVNKLAANELRVEPLGRDKSGLAYWCQLDEECNIRVYREDLDEESWQLVAKDRDGVVNLISTLSNGEAGDIPLNEDSNSLEISEKPIIDTGQVTSSPSLEDENREDLNGRVSADGKVMEDGESGEEDLEDEEDEEEDDEDEQGEEEEEEEEEGEVDEEEDGDEEGDEGDVTNEDSSQQNTEEDDSQDDSILRSETAGRKIAQLESVARQPQDLAAALPAFEAKKIRSPEPAGSQIPTDIRGKAFGGVETGFGIKHAETTVIKTSPIKVVNIAELTKPTEERKLDLKVPIGITLTPVTKQTPREDIIDAAKTRDNLPSKSSMFFSPCNEPKLSQNKVSLKPIDKLAANLVKLQSEKLEKPSGIKSLEKIAENLARSSGIHGIVTSPEDDRPIPEFFARNQMDKTVSSRSQRGMDLSTSPRGWESVDRNRPVDFSGIDLSSRKIANKTTELPSPGYRSHDFQHKEIDLSTRKPGRSDLSSIPYDARTTMPRSHGVIADLSKRQTLPPLPFGGYDLPPAYRNSVEHRLSNYGFLGDPSKINTARMAGVKRPLEDDDVPHDITKRIHADVIPIRGNMDKRQIIASNWREEVGEAIEEPIMMVQGEGSGSDCDAVNPGIGEATDEPVIYFYGEGMGYECDTGNPPEETTADNEDSKESKNDVNVVSLQSSSANETASTDDSSGLKTTKNYSQPGTSAADSLQARETGLQSAEADKNKFKPTLGVQIFTKSAGSPVKRLSRWDVRRPVEMTGPESDAASGLASGAAETQTMHEEGKNSELPTIKESTKESQDEAETVPSNLSRDDEEAKNQTEDCDNINRSDASGEGEQSSTLEEPCRHDSSTSVGAGLIKAIIPGLLAVPAAENLAEKQSEDSSLEARNSTMESSKDTNIQGEEGTEESLPRFFFGPNCISYNLKNEEKKDEAVEPSADTDSRCETNVSQAVSEEERQTENESIAKLADDLAKTVSIEKSRDSLTEDKSISAAAERETDCAAESQSLDKAVDSVPETLNTEPVSAGEGNIGEGIDSGEEKEKEAKKSTDFLPVNERFGKLAVSEAEKTLDSISDDESIGKSIDAEDETSQTKETTDFIPVSKSFEKLVVSEAGIQSENEILGESSGPEAEIAAQTQESTPCLPADKENKESTDLISKSESTEETTGSMAEEESIDSSAKVESAGGDTDFVPDTQSIEQQSSHSVDELDNVKEPIQSILVVESVEKTLEDSESLKKSTVSVADPLVDPDSIDEAKSPQTVTENVEDSTDSLPDQSITTEVDSPKKVTSVEESRDDQPGADATDNQELEDEEPLDIKDTEELGEETKTSENISDLQQEPEKQQVRESETEQSLEQINEAQLSEEFPESQAISERGTSINEDELLKSSSDSDQDQNVEGEKNSVEEKILWSSQSEAAEKVKKTEETACKDVNKEQDGSTSLSTSLQQIEDQTELVNKVESKLEPKDISDAEKSSELVAETADDAASKAEDDSLAETSRDDDRSQDIECKESKESSNTAADEKPDLETEQNSPLLDKAVEIPQTELPNNDPAADEIDKSSTVKESEDELPKKEEFYFNRITPTAITDSNISKSPERVTVDSKTERDASALADIADDYCNPASENPSSSADQDSNEAMVIDDRMYDSNESSKDLADQDSALKDDKAEEEEEKEAPHPLAVKVDDAVSDNKGSKESQFNLKDVCGSSKQDTAVPLPVQIENESRNQAGTEEDKSQETGLEGEDEAELTEDNLLDETKRGDKTVEKCTIESELEEAEDTAENLTQDTSTDDQKSLVANYDSSDRESDDVFENDLGDDLSNADEFNDTESNELLVEKDQVEDLLEKIDQADDKAEENDGLLTKSKAEVSEFVGESRTDLDAARDEAKIWEDVDKESSSELNRFKANTESIETRNTDEVIEARTSSGDMSLQNEETEKVVEEDKRPNIEKPTEARADDEIQDPNDKAEKLSEPIITNAEETKESWPPPGEVLNAELKSGTKSEDGDKREASEVQELEVGGNKSPEKNAEETVPHLVQDVFNTENKGEAVSVAVEATEKDSKETVETEAGESLTNSAISNLEEVRDVTISKSLENRVLEEEKSILTNKLDIVNEPLPLTVAAKHSLEPDTNDSNESDDQAEDELFEEEEPPIVHHSKRFKEDLNVPMLAHDDRELKVISLFAKDLKRKDPAEFTAGTDLINHSINYNVTTKLGGSEDPESLRTTVMDQSKTTILDKTGSKTQGHLISSENSSKDEADKVDLNKADSDAAVISPVVGESPEVRKDVDIARKECGKEEMKILEEVPNPEDILSMKSKQMSFELLTKSNASVNETVNASQKLSVSPENSFTEIMAKRIDNIKRDSANIQNNDKPERMQLLDTPSMKKTIDTKAEGDSEIQSVDLKVVTIESDDSMGADNDDAFSDPQNEIDPLACIDEDTSAKNVEANASALGIRVKPVSELVYEGWKLDGTETPKISRKRRNSNHESNSEDVLMKDEDDESEGTGGKRMRLRGKRPPDMNLRRTVEEKRQEAASSDDETVKKPTDMVKEDSKEGGEDLLIIDSVSNDKKTRGRPKGKRKVRRTIRLPGRPAPTSGTTETQGIDTSLGTDPSTGVLSSPVIGSDTPQKKRKKRKMVLGLEIGRDIVDTSQPGALLLDNPVRQSRRIAQIKIKEEADRRRMEEETLCELKEKKDRDVGDKRKRKKQKAESEEEVSSKEVERDSKAKKKRKKKKRKKKPSSSKFDETNPWRSSSGSSTEEDENQDEDDDDDEEVESEGSVLFKSDHEFSPESDLEKDEESEPLRRARTAQKAQSDDEEADDEYACQKCGKADHPEWILLCDTCDKGWHCSCLRPALMLIPEGDWFCPPCQHNLLVTKLQDNLKKYDQDTKKHENELLRKKRLAFVGISLDNVLHTKDTQRSSRASSQDSDNDSSSSASSSSSGSSSSEDSEPVYQLRERRCANTYKFNEYDDMINAAIQDEVEAVRGAGNQGRGKDIATIVNAEKEEAQAEAMMKTQQEVEEDEEEDRKLEKDSDEDYKAEKDEEVEEEDDDDEKPKVSVKKTLSRKKHRKLNSLDISSEDDPESDEDFKGTSSDEDEDPEDQASSSDDSCFANTRRRGRRGGGAPVRRSTRARMTRYDEDFINDDSEDSDRPKRKKSRSVWDESESEESDNSWRQRKKRSKTLPTPKSRSATKSKSKRRSKKKKRVIESDNQSDNEEEEEEAEPNIERNEPDETAVTESVPDAETTGDNEEKYPIQNEEEDGAAGDGEEIKPEETEDNKGLENIPIIQTVDDEKLAKKKKETTPKRKKTPPIRRKIIYGGLGDYPKQEEETLGRRTRGKKINYQEVMASDSEEELKKALKKTEESEDEFVVNEVEDLNEEAEKDSDSGDIYSPKKEGLSKPKGKSPKGKKPRKSKSPATKQKLINDNETPKARKKPGPKPGSKNKPRSAQKMTPPFGNPRSGEEGDVTAEEGSLAGLGPGELAELDEEQLDQMMMEDEEYGKRQLELAAIEIARKKKEEREAKKLEKARLKALEILAAERQRDPNAPEGTDGEAPKKKKRGRRSKAEILAEQMRRDGAPNLSIESTTTSSPNVTTAILSPSVNLTNPSLTSSPSLSSVNLNPNLSSFLNPNAGINIATNITPTMVPNLTSITINASSTPETQKIPENLVPVLAGGPTDAHSFSTDGGMIVKPKRRGRGKGKKTLALEAARAAEAAAKGTDHISGFGTDSNPDMKSDDQNVLLPTPGSSTSGSAPSTPPSSISNVSQATPSSAQSQPSSTVQQSQSYPPMPSSQQQQQQSSVITRMLQSQPVSGGPQSFAAAAAAMGHKYFGAPNTGGNIMGVPRPGFDLQPRGRIPSPYRQPGQSPMPPHFAAVRSATPSMRMRVPGPQMYHTPHHPMDPSPSGGGPISISSSRDRSSSSPLGPGPGPAMIPPAAGSPLTKGGGPTPPPPPPYARGVPPMGRFPDSSPMGGPRHQIPPFANASGTNHSLQQPSPPPNRAAGNFSPYHPPPPPNYHYGAYPPPPPMTTADDAAAYQGSPYPSEHFSTPSENPAPIQPPIQPPPQTQSQTHTHPHPHPHPGETAPGAGNKQFDEEGSGEFGGLVSYFSSQREDDLDS